MQRFPGLSSLRPPRVLMAIAAVLALIGLGGVATGAADKPDKTVAADNASDTTTTTDESGGLAGGDRGAVAGLTTTTGAAGGRTTTSMRSTGTTAKQSSDAPPADCPLPPAATADPGPTTPPAVGTYEYVTCSDANEPSEESKVEDKPGDAKRRLVTTKFGGYPATKTEFYGPNGVFQETFTVAGVATCDWNPDVLEFPSSVGVGTAWSADSSCTITSPQGTGTIHLTASAKITGKVAFPVGAASVNSWVIESTAHVAISGKDAKGQPQNTSYDVISKLYFDPTHGIDLYRHLEFKSQEETRTVIDRLKSLTPTKNS